MKPNTYISLERNITSIMRSLRESHRYSQEYVAAELGINQNTYSKLESGQTQITIKRLEQLSRVYNVELITFFKDPEIISKQPSKRIESKKMNTLLQILRAHHNYGAARIAAELKITEPEYNQLEAGGLKLTFRQALILSDLYNIEPAHLLASNNPVINYNIGTKSRGITNVTHYYEDALKNQTAPSPVIHNALTQEEP